MLSSTCKAFYYLKYDKVITYTKNSTRKNMKKLTVGMVALIVAIIFSGCATGNSSQKSYPKAENIDKVTFLTATEVKNLYSGRNFYGKNLKFNADMDVFYSKDGTYKGTVANGRKAISGKWFVKDDGTKCNVNPRGEWCEKIYKENNFYVGIRNGTKLFEAKFK